MRLNDVKALEAPWEVYGSSHHGKKGFVILTKSYVKIGITKHFLQQQNV